MKVCQGLLHSIRCMPNYVIIIAHSPFLLTSPSLVKIRIIIMIIIMIIIIIIIIIISFFTLMIIILFLDCLQI